MSVTNSHVPSIVTLSAAFRKIKLEEATGGLQYNGFTGALAGTILTLNAGNAFSCMAPVSLRMLEVTCKVILPETPKA
ncbi:MAG: hypothetical protein K0S32_3393 [Bacteroidetes bacterium]|jgi:hypothetical protein|nr:hypothetical protein [Bacteroidota bacterium]